MSAVQTMPERSPAAGGAPPVLRAAFPARTLGLIAGGLVLHLLLAATPLAGMLPAMLRLGLAFGLVVLLPGYAFVACGAAPPGGTWLSPGWALGFGVAWNALLLLATHALGLPFTVLGVAAVPINALLWGVVIALPRRAEARTATPAAPLERTRVALALVVAAAAVAWIHVARTGTPITYYSDSPDHIGTIRRMLASGDMFPTNAFFKDAGAAGMDPRKGLWHPQVALIARLAGVDPFDAWRMLSAWIAPLFVLNAAALGFLIGGGASAAIAAWALLLTYGGTLAGSTLREAVLATKLADQLALAASVAMLAALTRANHDVAGGSTVAGAPRPAPMDRLACTGLILAAIAAHVFATLEFTLVFGALGIGLAIRDRGIATARRLLALVLPGALIALPYVLWRSHGAHPVNVIHTESQGLLTLWDHVRVVMFGVLWEWMGRLWILFPLSWWALWRDRRNVAALWLLTTSAAVALVIFDPVAVRILEPRLGYLLMRMIWIVPLAGLIAWLLPALARRIAGAHGRERMLLAAALAVVAALFLPVLLDAARALARPHALLAAEEVDGVARWRAPLAWLDRSLPPGSVILSDPATSYAIPMLTRHYVVTLADQHSSPNDPRALERILDARDALDPYGAWERTREVIERYGVDAIVLNDQFAHIPGLDYWAPTPRWFEGARARLDAQPAAFERLRDAGGFVVYRVHHERLAGLAGATPRPYVVPYAPGRFRIARRVGEGVPVLQGFRLWPLALSPGDTLHGVAEWRVLEPLPPGEYHVAVRFDRALPGGFAPPAAIAKPIRKMIERLRGERYRFRDEHLPAAGGYGVDAWRPDEVVRDSFEYVVPREAAEGAYLVRVKMLRTPHYPNLRLSDYFSDDDLFSGIVWGEMRLARDLSPGAAWRREPPLQGGH